MSKSARWTAKRRLAVAGSILVVAVGLSWSHLRAYSAHRAASYAALAAHEPDKQKAIGEYELAQALDPGNADYRLRLAQLYLAQSQPGKALTALQPLSTPAATLLRTKVYLEQGKGDIAAEAASLHLQGSGLVLAQELYSRQMYLSSQRILTGVDASPAKYLLLSQVLLAKQPSSHAQVLAAQSAAQKGTALDPASLPLHELLEGIDNKLGDHTAANQEQQLINQLQSGGI